VSRINRDETIGCHRSDYIIRRTTQGLTSKEILRCLKRHTIRQLYRFLNTNTALTP
jgi:hypothetical protein